MSQYDGPCAFCGAQLTMRGEPHYDVLHAMPMCETFERLDALSFVIEHRRKLGIPAPKEHAD